MTKRRCEAVTARGEPCKARPLQDQDFCLLHSPDSSPAELGRKGGRGRGRKTDELELSDRELAFAALRRSLDSGNAAAVVAAGKALIDLAQKDPGRDWGSHAEVLRARETLTRKLQEMAGRWEEAPTREATRPVVSALSVEPTVSPRSVPFQDPAFVQALEERRSLGLGPMRWEDED